ncbi:SusC/RagA family TonB-linked outer membrane protein [Flexithrix dorotheae]|uniref:SusC/RagA family TonB-linked outer membrane protein n=1 Tax=Flexithrix dorotheae TaxID=70993 RepID=UPI001FE0722E|nr:SusC/RagA family TonB-linked outer membrane protein [Flexithrix dorotheae]
MKLKSLRQIIIMSSHLMLFIFLQSLLGGLLHAENGLSQSKKMEEIYMSIHVENQSLKEIFGKIQSETGLEFTYNHKIVDDHEQISLKFKKESLFEILTHIARVKQLKFKRINNNIHVNLNQPVFSDNKLIEEEILQVLVKGKVLSGEDGEPLPGVSILIKGTANGTTTDLDGNFSLNTPEDAILQFSYIGFQIQEVAVNNQSTINVTLNPDLEQLEEVVVVGYGTQEKKDLTGAITSVKPKDIRNVPVSNADALLQGKAAGVQVVQNSGTPGAEVFVRVRGSGSLLGESRPLYVIDGVPMNNISGTFLDAGGQRTSALSDINPNDIESIEILKDASATAIYGSRGSNGVVLITTKRGKEGRSKFAFDAYHGVQEVWKTLDVLNGQQYIDLIRESRNNRAALNPSFDPLAPPYDQLEVTGINTDWQDAVFRKAPISSYNLSVSGGGEKTQSFVSMGYFRQQGTIIGQDFNRFNGRVNLDHQASEKLKIGTSITYSYSNRDRVANDFSSNSILALALLKNPNLPVYNPDGSYSVDPLRINNPVMLANEIYFKSIQKRFIGNVYAEYKIADGLTFRSNFGMDNISDRQDRYEPSFVIDDNGVAEAQAVSYEEFVWLNENTLTYNTTIGSNHNVTALAGLSFQESRQTSLQAGGLNAGSDIVPTLNAISDPTNPNHYITNWGLLSYFGRLNYDYNNKYIASASFRVDGSSRFGENKRYGFFPSVSVGWRISEEAFLQDFGLIDDMKLRASFGITGNQEGFTSNFPSLPLYNTGGNYSNSEPGIYQGSIGNPNLSWESTEQTNIGMDVAFFEGRLSTSVDAYIKNTKDLIFVKDLPWTSGFWSIPAVNLGDLQNKGIEFILSSRNFVGAFQWTTDFNISFNRNKITYLPNDDPTSPYGSDYFIQMPGAFGANGPTSIYRVGEPVGSFYAFVYQGVYPTDADVPENLQDKEVKGGDSKFWDTDGDGFLNRGIDRRIVGNALPLHTGGFTNTFSYKGIDLSIFLNWSYGNDIYNMTGAVLEDMSDDYNQSTKVLRRWKNQGDITDVPKAIYGTSSVSGASNNESSSRFIEDGSFLRIKNVTLGYSFPQHLIEKVKLSSARIYVAAQNLVTITNYSGYDPENQNLSGSGSAPSLGVDYLTQPQPRTYMMGINLNF